MSPITEQRSKPKASLARLWQWAKDQIVQEVPEDIGLCEYDCRKKQCVMDEWETCDWRLHKGQGELMP
jgi:hypothetical protein